MRNIILVVLFFCFGCCLSLMAEVAFDFNNSGTTEDRDLAIFIAWKKFINSGYSANEITNSMVLAAAQKLLQSVSVVARLPEINKDNLSSENFAVLDDQDIAFFIAYNKLVYSGLTNITFSNVETAAAKLINITTSLGKMPGTAIGDSGLTTTITGIQAD